MQKKIVVKMGEEICKDLDPYYQKIRYQVMPIE